MNISLSGTVQLVRTLAEITYVGSSDWADGDKKIFLEILQNAWKDYAPRDTEQFEIRIKNSRGAIIGAFYKGKASAVVEPLFLNTAGDAENVPADFFSLTGNGDWSTHKADSDSVILVDLTVDPRMHGLGIANSIIEHAKALYWDTHHVMTYSPETAESLHKRHGAYPARRIENGRPNFTNPNVVVMQYETAYTMKALQKNHANFIYSAKA